MAPRTSRSNRRVVKRAATAVVVVALAVGGVAGVRALRPDDEIATLAAPILKVAAVEAGTMAVDQQIDGSVVLSATTTVRHRIEGQLAVTSASAAASAASTPTAGPPTGPQTAIVTNSAVEPCVVPDVPDSTTSTTTTSTPTTSTTGDDSSTTSTTTSEVPVDQTTTSTAVVPDPPTTTVVVQCPDPTTTTTTVPDDTTSTVVPDDPSTTAVDPSVVVGPQRPGNAPTAGAISGPTGSATGAATGAPDSGSTRTTQKVTSTIAPGTAVVPGDVLYTVDGTPATLLNGLLPAWRTLSADVDDGADVLQLEWSLVGLGYDPGGTVEIDEQWDDATTDMVEAWQAGMGREATGEVPLGSVVFLSTAATVADVTAAVGDDIGEGDVVLTLAAPTQEVVIDVPVELQASVVAGLPVDLDGTDGTVSLLRTVERDGEVVVQAVITPDAELVDRVNGSSISVDISSGAGDASALAADLLLIPVEALASRLDGSYAVQVDHGDGTSTWVEVAVMAVDGNTVGVTSDTLSSGANVLLPV